MAVLDKGIVENANKIAFLVQQYPKHTMAMVIKLLEMPPIDINVGIWAAIDMGFIAEPDTKTDYAEFLREPVKGWSFGERTVHLENSVVYAARTLAAKAQDLEEFYITQWAMGFPSHEVMVALLHLVSSKRLVRYTIDDFDEDGNPNVYTFYTLPENSEQEWGRKEFKVDPAKKTKKKRGRRG